MKLRVVALFALIVSACARMPAEPANESPVTGGGFPLAVGNVWTFDATFSITRTDDSGTLLEPPTLRTGEVNRVIIGTEQIDGREYFTQAFAIAVDGGQSVTEWYRYRQDHDGFWEADVPLSVPPGTFPDDVEIAELARVALPLEVGKSWRLFGDAGPLLTVAAKDTLVLPFAEQTAWRIEVEPQDSGGAVVSTTVWYGESGLVRSESRREFSVLDVTSGQPFHITTLEIHELSALVLTD